MPKSHSEFPVNLNLRISIAQRDVLESIAELHNITPSQYVRALLDMALDAEAKRVLGVPGAPSDVVLARAREVLREEVAHA